MSTNKTPNYQLNQWVKSDQVLMDEFNADNSKIDAELNTLSGQVAAKADQSALNTLNSRVTSLTTTVNGKASQSSVNALKTVVDKLGNCQIDFFTYTGTGTTGASGPTRVTFPRKPLFFRILNDKYSATGAYQMDRLQLDLSQNNSVALTTWSGNQLSFYADTAERQLNKSGATYYVIALSAMD